MSTTLETRVDLFTAHFGQLDSDRPKKWPFQRKPPAIRVERKLETTRRYIESNFSIDETRHQFILLLELKRLRHTFT